MLFKIIGILGSLAIAASTFIEWATLVFIRFEETSVKKVGGIETLQGLIAVIAGGLALLLMIIRPKLAIIPGAIALGSVAWFYLGELAKPYKPGMGLLVAVGGAVLVIAASFLYKPKGSKA